MDKPVRWGIIGLGKIAHKFAHDLLLVDNCKLRGVASRSKSKAEAFAKTYKAEATYGSYNDLVADPNIDAIYIATPHVFHKKNTLLCLKHGKAVLCEKPMGIDKEEVEAMASIAKEENVLLMEAMWSVFHPHFAYIKEKYEEGDFGKIKSLSADFGFIPEFDPNGRLYKKELGGGSLLDIGIYPIFIALYLLGEPNNIQAKATFYDSGVDSSCEMVFNYEDGCIANLKSTLLENTPTTCTIEFERATVIMHSKFHMPTSITITSRALKESKDFESIGYGYAHEIIHFNRLFQQDKKESPIMPLSMSLKLSETMDKVKDIIGLSYQIDAEKPQNS